MINFLVKDILHGTLEMKQPKILVKRVLSDVSHPGNLHKEMLVRILFLSQTERELFEIRKKRLGYSDFWKEKWEYMWLLDNDKGTVIIKLIRARV